MRKNNNTKKKPIKVKNQLPALLAAVCNHKDCPQWLRHVIFDGFNDRTDGVTYTENYFRYAIEQATDVPDCSECGQPILRDALFMHNSCEKILNAMQSEVVQ